MWLVGRLLLLILLVVIIMVICGCEFIGLWCVLSRVRQWLKLMLWKLLLVFLLVMLCLIIRFLNFLWVFSVVISFCCSVNLVRLLLVVVMFFGRVLMLVVSCVGFRWWVLVMLFRQCCYMLFIQNRLVFLEVGDVVLSMYGLVVDLYLFILNRCMFMFSLFCRLVWKYW